MWLRNIIWFIILIGIIIFSLLLFILIMNPVPDNNQLTTDKQIQNNTASPSSPIPYMQGKTEVQPAGKEQVGKEPAPSQDGTGAADGSMQSNKPSPGTQQQEAVNEAPKPTAKTEVAVSMPVLYFMGKFVGYFVVVTAVFPVFFLTAGRMPRSAYMRRFYRQASTWLPFSAILSLTVGALHGGIMLRLQAASGTAGIIGMVAFFFYGFLLLQESLTFIYESNKRRKRLLPVLILLLLLILHLWN
ncbi:hypothetical protein [Aneurinibacillus terranovensis]|uniref:hypothetical protein n=1 Tax=Aneurinibacillus terranovensis TaxID=278991 RepID=UPI0004217731|nr:hypothetical protein [Aneurinibacillus terranovensis]